MNHNKFNTPIFQAEKSAHTHIVILLMFFNQMSWAMGCMGNLGTLPEGMLSDSERNLLLRALAGPGK